MCVYVYVYEHVYEYGYEYVHLYVYIYIHAYTYSCMYIYMYLCTEGLPWAVWSIRVYLAVLMPWIQVSRIGSGKFAPRRTWALFGFITVEVHRIKTMLPRNERVYIYIYMYTYIGSRLRELR